MGRPPAPSVSTLSTLSLPPPSPPQPQQAPVSQASARQRAGRAGRTQPGCCYRLYTEAAFHRLPTATPPEMQRASLAWPVLQLKALGVDDVLHFDFVSPPSVAAMLHGLEILYSLGALDDQCQLTPEGEVRAPVP